jgi:hypothetical protein
MSVIAWILDRCLALLMWTLLDPVGREVFRWGTASFLLLSAWLIWKFRKDI